MDIRLIYAPFLEKLKNFLRELLLLQLQPSAPSVRLQLPPTPPTPIVSDPVLKNSDLLKSDVPSTCLWKCVMHEQKRFTNIWMNLWQKVKCKSPQDTCSFIGCLSQACTSAFATKDRLRSHMIRHEGKVTCNICGKMLSAAYITSHLKTHGQTSFSNPCNNKGRSQSNFHLINVPLIKFSSAMW